MAKNDVSCRFFNVSCKRRFLRKIFDILHRLNIALKGRERTMNKQKNRAVIILVDDAEINLTIGETILAEQYIVITASSAEKMFSILNNIIPDMILLDIVMPEMDGYEVIKNLKSKPKTKDIPVIFVTGRTDPSDEEKGLSLGAVDYIKKPFKPDFLHKHIQICLKRYKVKMVPETKMRKFLID